ncbi:TIGR01459 family HAD-type hydrolase [Rhodovulum sp. DZ06]|uniref:TIGR01459 family HAD-type hydrolase n=1 Tax=Rhodovulum sp. DZ06 TaxID=3425126 RepID=UPI003D3571CC
MTEILPGLAALHGRFDAFLVDQFGVLLDGTGAYPSAPAALAALAATGARVLLLSNSGRRAQPNIDRLLSFGFGRGSFETVLSSGEAAHGMLRARIGGALRPGARVLVVSRVGDGSETEGLDLVPTDDPDAAELVLISGSRGDELGLDAYADLLRGPASRGVPCLCTNPDMVMLTPAGRSFGPARIAQLYEGFGGAVEMIGKPHRPVYEIAHRMLGAPDPARVLCIGDSPAHDLKGAATLGFRGALVRTGIHDGIDDAARLALCAAEGVRPDFILPRFADG